MVAPHLFEKRALKSFVECEEKFKLFCCESLGLQVDMNDTSIDSSHIVRHTQKLQIADLQTTAT